jgi:ribosomal RNA-processing protein 12
MCTSGPCQCTSILLRPLLDLDCCMAMCPVPRVQHCCINIYNVHLRFGTSASIPQVRVIVERLARRCGFDDVAAHIPPSESRLLTHIRKEHNRKVRRRQAVSEVSEA